MAFDYAYYEMAERGEQEEANKPTFTAVPTVHVTKTTIPMVTTKRFGLILPPSATAGDSDGGSTTGGSGSSNSSGDGSGDDDAEDDGGDDDQQNFPLPTPPKTYIPPNIRMRTYSKEVRYRDAIFRPFLMNQDWDRGPDFRLCRDFVTSCRDQDDNIVPHNVLTLDRYTHDTYPYVWDYEWEVVPGRLVMVVFSDDSVDVL